MRLVQLFSVLLMVLPLLGAPAWAQEATAASIPFTYLPGSEDGRG